jgi:hypothetical protein
MKRWAAVLCLVAGCAEHHRVDLCPDLEGQPDVVLIRHPDPDCRALVGEVCPCLVVWHDASSDSITPESCDAIDVCGASWACDWGPGLSVLEVFANVDVGTAEVTEIANDGAPHACGTYTLSVRYETAEP